MRGTGVQAVIATCQACGHKADVNVDAFARDDHRTRNKATALLRPVRSQADRHAAGLALVRWRRAFRHRWRGAADQWPDKANLIPHLFIRCRRWLEIRILSPAVAASLPSALRPGGGCGLIGREDRSMNADHPLVRAALVRAALVNAAIGGALVLAACTVAALAFELENRWTLLASLVVAGICSLVAVRSVLDMRTHRGKGIR
jgi:hypothetical protein